MQYDKILIVKNCIIYYPSIRRCMGTMENYETKEPYVEIVSSATLRTFLETAIEPRFPFDKKVTYSYRRVHLGIF